MSGQAYQGSAKRTFVQAVVHLLETEYSLVANGRIAQLLAEDVCALTEHFTRRLTASVPVGWFSPVSRLRVERRIRGSQPAPTSW